MKARGATMGRRSRVAPAGRDGGPSWAFKLALRAFPRRFREAHAHDLYELYRDFDGAGRRIGRLPALWDLLRNGIGTRRDDRRGGSPLGPQFPRKRGLAMDSVWKDIVFGARMLRKSPAFTAIAVLSLAIGIGANTAVFGLVNAALLHSLPVESPEELVVLGWRSRAGNEMPDVMTWGWGQQDDNGDYLSSSYSIPAFEMIRSTNDVLTTTFAFAELPRINVNVDGQAELASGQVVSGNYYAALGIRAPLGRLIVEDDDRPGADAVVVISHGYWQRRFGAAPDVLGTTVRINDAPFTVIGVAPEGFRGTLQVGSNPDLAVPLSARPLVATDSRDRTAPDAWWLHLMGRKRPEIAMEVAQASLTALWHQSVEADLYPGGVPEPYTLPEVDLRPGFQGMTEQRGLIRRPLMIMSLVVGSVLLIACINVANLLLARSGVRRREIAVRLSIGASRGRLVRQLLAESVLLSSLAGGVGVLFAVWGREVLLGAMVMPDLHMVDAPADARVLGFGLAASLLTGVLFGLAPALRASRPDVAPALKTFSGDTAQDSRGLWGPRTLMVAQVGLSLVLLITAGLFVRSLANIEREATGFDAEGVAILSMDATLNGYEGARHIGLYDELLRRIRGLPGVGAATITNHTPVSGRISMTTLRILEYEPGEDERMGVFYNLVAPEFFDTFQIPVVRGRAIDERDRDGTPMVAVVNELFADRYFAGDDPIGKRFGLGAESDPLEYEIVGVAADVKYQILSDREHPVAHVAVDQHAGALRSMTLALRTSGDTGEAIAGVRGAVRAIDPNIPLFAVRTLMEQQNETLEIERLFARMSTLLGSLALLLACIGLYGILSYNVVRRTREIGVRMALGARPADVMRLVARELRSVLVGVALGIAAALAVTRYIESQLYELSTTDPATICVATLVLLVVAAAAAYLPARRASAVDPIVALRFD